tara:strand:- start:330 stop:557 length:228 start_codon:yes stop_codon:yes gene_type:complete
MEHIHDAKGENHQVFDSTDQTAKSVNPNTGAQDEFQMQSSYQTIGNNKNVNFDSSGFQELGRGEQASHNNPFQQQ